MSQRFWGLIIIVVGVFLLLQVTGVYELGLAFWPVVLFLVGIAFLWESISRGYISWFWIGLGLWVGGIGLFSILHNAGITVLTGSDIARYGWPLILVAIGLSVLLGNWGIFCCMPGKDRRKKREDWISCSKMHTLGDLYHGRTSWVIDQDQEFYHGLGDVVIDLTTADIKPGNYKIFVKVGMGEAKIRVPSGVNIEAEASVGIGELNLFGEKRSGISSLLLKKVIDESASDVTLRIEARVGVGDLTLDYVPVK